MQREEWIVRAVSLLRRQKVLFQDVGCGDEQQPSASAVSAEEPSGTGAVESVARDVDDPEGETRDTRFDVLLVGAHPDPVGGIRLFDDLVNPLKTGDARPYAVKG
ncbi:hypothetical protein ACFWD7_55395 [Streptomyces mirabilis]|uniref:hypothetical protein n=1 Tax=Streptomyces mirabilis TaxID=68239 RepID=UPI00367B6865